MGGSMRKKSKRDGLINSTECPSPLTTTCVLLGASKSGKTSFFNLLKLESESLDLDVMKNEAERTYLKAVSRALDTVTKATISEEVLVESLEAAQKRWKELKSEHSTSLLLELLGWSDFLDVMPVLESLDDEVIARGHVPTNEINECRPQSDSSHPTVTCYKTESRVRFVDIGGLRSERKKWIRTFSANVVLFFISLTDYFQVLTEDPETLRITDSLMLWQEVSKCKLLANSTFVIVLTKLDLFAGALPFKFKEFCRETGYSGSCVVIDCVEAAIKHINVGSHQVFPLNILDPKPRKSITDWILTAQIGQDGKVLFGDPLEAQNALLAPSAATYSELLFFCGHKDNESIVSMLPLELIIFILSKNAIMIPELLQFFYDLQS